ncbi:hypothetical protein DL93DRAFT_717042 [Clavulina sp. PMI_390]|nr:hypothetical protein DL93DRAFT_717042 [Clavulina sp. PMI_390]
MSAAVAASPKRAHDLHTPPSLAKPAKKTLRSSLQETLRSAAGHVHVRTTNKERDAAPLDSTVGVAGGQGLTTSTTADMTRTTSRAVHHTNNNPSSPAINHQSRNPPRPPSRTATASPALSTSTTHSTSTAILSNPRLSPSPEPPADHDKTARGGKFLKLFTGPKSRLSSVNLRGDRARDRDTKKKDGEATFRAGAGFQAPTLRAGTLSDPALHTLARREKHQPLLSLAAAFDPSSTAQRGASKPPTTSSPASAAKGTVAGRRPSISTVTATTPTTSTPSRPTNASTTSLAASTRDRSESRASSRPPTTGPRGTGASAARPTSPTPTPSSPSKLASKRPPVSGISRSRLTSPSSPSLVQSSAEPIVSNDASRMRSTSRAGAVSPTPPPITKRSSVRKSVDEKQPGELSPSTAPTSAKIDTEGATVRRRSSSATRSSVSPTTPSSYKTAQSTQPHRSSLTSASTSNLPLSSSARAPTPTGPRRSATPVTGSSTSTPQKKRASLDTPASPESPSSPQRRSSNTQARPAPPQTSSQNSSKSSEEAATARAAIRAAINFIVRESSTPPYDLMQSSSPLLGRQWLQEMEVRTRGLMKLTKKWGDGERTVGADDDEKERKMFCDALRDGYILCQ